MATIGLDATYTVDRNPTGVGIYSRRLIESLATLETPHHFLLCYRLSRFRRRREFLRPAAASQSRGPRFSIHFHQDFLTFWLPRKTRLFHSLVQRPPAFRFEKEIVTVHEIFNLTENDYSTPDFKRKFASLLLESVRRAVRVIAVSQYVADQLGRIAGVPSGKIRVIPEGVDLPERLATDKERMAARERLVGKGNEMVFSVGVLQNRKNTLNALRALEGLPAHYRLALAGGDGYGSEAIHEFIRRERLDSRVVLLGHVDQARLPAFYQAASVFLFPSFEEGFGLPVLEAMANGAPVVAATASSLPEVGGDAAIYVDPHDPRDIGEKIQSVVEGQNLREKIIACGLSRARQFPWRRTAQETLKVYDEALAL